MRITKPRNYQYMSDEEKQKWADDMTKQIKIARDKFHALVNKLVDKAEGGENMPMFRKKPVVIEARQYTRNGIEAEEVAKWCGGQQADEGLIIHTLEGDHLANYGDWVIKGVKGEFYPIKPDLFEQTYESV